MMQVEFSSPDSWCKRLGNFQPINFVPPRGANPPKRVMRTHADNANGVIPANRAVLRRQITPHPERNARQSSAGRRPGVAAHVVTLMFGLLIAACMLGTPLASAQMGGGGGGMGGGHGGHGGQSNGSQSHTPSNNGQAPHAPNPLRAMLTEAHNLRADLMLTTAQIEPWSAMEDALRNCIELNRSRMPQPSTSANLDPMVFAEDYAENERALAEASTKFAASVKAVMAALNPRQRQTSMERFAAAISTETAPTVSQ